jgi:hypothetical protein
MGLLKREDGGNPDVRMRGKLYLDCECGHHLPMPSPYDKEPNVDTTCVCGRMYDSQGWILTGDRKAAAERSEALRRLRKQEQEEYVKGLEASRKMLASMTEEERKAFYGPKRSWCERQKDEYRNHFHNTIPDRDGISGSQLIVAVVIYVALIIGLALMSDYRRSGSCQSSADGCSTVVE